MNAKCFHIGLIWTFAIVAGGVAEDFNGRPAQTELETTVTKGMACARGVNERCYATQTSTNPTYSVSPPTFAGTNGGWYFDTNLVMILDSTAKALVLCYADQDTVYDGTTNIAMLAVTSLWAQLQIGDHTNEFTGTPAIGTNPPTYGDYPWRIYPESLQERYQVLNALQKRFLFDYVSDGTNFTGFQDYNKAKFKGSSGGASQPGHLYYTFDSGDLGPANNTEYNITIDTRVLGASGGSDYISLGKAGNRVPSYDGRAMCIFLDEHEGGAAESFLYSSSITFSGVVNIYNCWVIESYAGQSPSSSWTANSVTASSTLSLPDGLPTAFFFQPILDFPFQYCTDEY